MRRLRFRRRCGPGSVESPGPEPPLVVSLPAVEAERPPAGVLVGEVVRQYPLSARLVVQREEGRVVPPVDRRPRPLEVLGGQSEPGAELPQRGRTRPPVGPLPAGTRRRFARPLLARVPAPALRRSVTLPRPRFPRRRLARRGVGPPPPPGSASPAVALGLDVVEEREVGADLPVLPFRPGEVLALALGDPTPREHERAGEGHPQNREDDATVEPNGRRPIPRRGTTRPGDRPPGPAPRRRA